MASRSPFEDLGSIYHQSWEPPSRHLHAWTADGVTAETAEFHAYSTSKRDYQAMHCLSACWKAFSHASRETLYTICMRCP
jgi:hypothetical protein